MVPDHILPARHRPKAPLFCDAHEVVVDLIVLFGIALGLAMDAFAVSIAISVALGGTSRRQTFRLAWHFGLFQALMPIIGWIAGRSVRPLIESWDHWLAFGLLTIVGGRMILEALRTTATTSGARIPPAGGPWLSCRSLQASTLLRSDSALPPSGSRSGFQPR